MEGKKHKILLCEDDTNLGSVLKNYLELNDYDVTLERDGRLGLAAFQREKFDICLLDVMMPNMDGFTLAEEIRDLECCRLGGVGAVDEVEGIADAKVAANRARLGLRQ